MGLVGLDHTKGGWSGELKDGDVAKWKPASEMVMTTISFAIATGRLEDKRKGRGESNNEQSESELRKDRQKGGKTEETHVNSTPLANKPESFRLSTPISPIHGYRQPEFYPWIGVAVESL